MVKLHVGDQADAKVLLGTYVCTDVPGEFRWQAGALTQAVREGKWMLVEVMKDEEILSQQTIENVSSLLSVIMLNIISLIVC
jgi:midasin (ATPase involved in ribosome maturation)